MSAEQKIDFANFLHYPHTRPDFLSYCVDDLPNAIPFLLRTLSATPVMAWTVRTPAQRRLAARWADQIVFEGTLDLGILSRHRAQAPTFGAAAHCSPGSDDSMLRSRTSQSSHVRCPFNVRIAREIAKVDAAQWDACANPPDLERRGRAASGSILSSATPSCWLSNSRDRSAGARGWAPMHVLVEDEAGRLVAAAPTYAKSHSQGEYVFDHGWAQAYARAGGRYYPKLQVAVPFTPATGRRLLVAPNAPPEARAALIAGLRGLCKAINASSIHVTFANASRSRGAGRGGLFAANRRAISFRQSRLSPISKTFSPPFPRASARISSASARMRWATASAIEWVTGAALKREHWDAFFAFYMDTGSRKWGSPYLTRDFFDLVGASMADRILLVMAKREGRYIAGAINFIGDDALYGRNWGAIEEHPFLHFEVCYYQAIDFAIQRGLKRVEAGAQGEHKLARGYRPVPTFSLHDFADRRLGRSGGRISRARTGRGRRDDRALRGARALSQGVTAGRSRACRRQAFP